MPDAVDIVLFTVRPSPAVPAVQKVTQKKRILGRRENQLGTFVCYCRE